MSYCDGCTNPRETDCQYCIGTGGKKDYYERTVVTMKLSPVVIACRSILKGKEKKDQHVLPFKFE